MLVSDRIPLHRSNVDTASSSWQDVLQVIDAVESSTTLLPTGAPEGRLCMVIDDKITVESRKVHLSLPASQVGRLTSVGDRILKLP